MILLISLLVFVSSSMVLQDVNHQRINPPSGVVMGLLYLWLVTLIVVVVWVAVYGVRIVIG